MKYEVLIDYYGTVHIDVEANSVQEAGKIGYEEYKKEFAKTHEWAYEEYVYIQDEDGNMDEWEGEE